MNRAEYLAEADRLRNAAHGMPDPVKARVALEEAWLCLGLADRVSAAVADPRGTFHPRPTEGPPVEIRASIYVLTGFLDGCLDSIGRTDLSAETWLREFVAAFPTLTATP